MPKANLRNKIITENQSNFSLKGMVNPTFQNEGDGDVVIDIRTVKPGSSYGVYAPNHVLQNEVNITFKGTKDRGQRLLYLAYVEEIEEI